MTTYSKTAMMNSSKRTMTISSERILGMSGSTDQVATTSGSKATDLHLSIIQIKRASSGIGEVGGNGGIQRQIRRKNPDKKNLIPILLSIGNKGKKPLNSWLAFRCYYSAMFIRSTQKIISAVLTIFWQEDPFKAKWSILAKSWTMIRDSVGPTDAPLPAFLEIAASFMNVVKPEDYLDVLGWQVETIDGTMEIKRQATFNEASLKNSLYILNISVEEVIQFCRQNGFITSDESHVEMPKDQPMMIMTTAPSIGQPGSTHQTTAPAGPASVGIVSTAKTDQEPGNSRIISTSRLIHAVGQICGAQPSNTDIIINDNGVSDGNVAFRAISNRNTHSGGSVNGTNGNNQIMNGSMNLAKKLAGNINNTTMSESNISVGGGMLVGGNLPFGGNIQVVGNMPAAAIIPLAATSIHEIAATNAMTNTSINSPIDGPLHPVPVINSALALTSDNFALNEPYPFNNAFSSDGFDNWFDPYIGSPFNTYHISGLGRTCQLPNSPNIRELLRSLRNDPLFADLQVSICRTPQTFWLTCYIDHTRLLIDEKGKGKSRTR
uniref:Putative mating type protein MAT1-1-1 n=1 Tax=Icmadophila splachnirima TaxID=1651172 RepID=A0A0U2BXI1_9LECA|nr:putative mating type protein MAT1-1-1 [Knightiella splachnirima]